MPTNPYAAFLADHDARAVLAATPGLLHQACCALTPEQLDAPHAPGKWSPREIAAHLADCELAFSFRLRQTLVGEPGYPATLQPFDQHAWAQRYAAYDLPSALELFRAARGWNLKLIGGLSEADFERIAVHAERGEVTFRWQIELMAGHDLNHLRQVERLATG